jgi:hypothetical protein
LAAVKTRKPGFYKSGSGFANPNHNILVAKMVEFGLSDVIIRWICSFLTDRRQRVKIGDVFSGWQLVNAGMAQGSYLGPLTFIILIDSLKSACLTHKFVDDTTLSEILEKGAPSKMQHSIDELLVWSTQHAMSVNERKTKEMIIGPITNQPPTPLTLDGATIDLENLQISRSPRLGRSQVVTSHRSDLLQGCVSSSFFETPCSVRRPK